MDKLGKVPHRSDFYKGQLHSLVISRIVAKKPIQFQPVCIEDYNEYGRYKIRMFGILISGAKVCVILNDIYVYVDIVVPKGLEIPMKSEDFEIKLRQDLLDNDIKHDKIENLYGKLLRGFQKNKTLFKRIFFNNLYTRSNAIRTLQRLNYETASDDTSNYYIKVATEYKYNTSSWNNISSYSAEKVSPVLSAEIEYIIKANISNFTPCTEDQCAKMTKNNLLVMCWDTEEDPVDKRTGNIPRAEESTSFRISAIGMSFHWQYTTEPLVRICLVDRFTAPSEEFIVINCDNEEEMLKAFLEIFRRMNPDITVAFNNGGFDTPIIKEKFKMWKLLPMMKAKMSSVMNPYTAKDTSESIEKQCFKKETVKISAQENAYPYIFRIPGFIDTDAMIVFKKLYPAAEVGKGSSLNFYLKQNKLEGKEDMPIKRMFKIFDIATDLQQVRYDVNDIEGGPAELAECNEEMINTQPDQVIALITAFMKNTLSKESNIKDQQQNYVLYHLVRISALLMRSVAKYCVIDAYRCQQLYIARSIIDDKRELSNISYVSLYESFYRADGMKVRTLVAAECFRAGIIYSSMCVSYGNKPDKYPGAWVFKPIKGLNRKRPVTGLDATSLYPSIMMTYNLSLDKAVFSEEEANALSKEGYNIHEIGPFDRLDHVTRLPTGKKEHGWVVRHNGIFDAAKDKNIIIGYKKKDSGEYLRVDENGNERPNGSLVPIYGREALPGEEMGIFPQILKNLFDRRTVIKKITVGLEKLKEKIEKASQETNVSITEAHIISAGYQVQRDEKGSLIVPSYDDVVFRYNKMNSKQRAMKVHMNTFYGEIGYPTSPLYLMLIAGAVSSGGRYNIKMIYEYVRSLGCTVHYGDTDSVYISCPEECFTDVDAQYTRELEELAQQHKQSGMYDMVLNSNVNTMSVASDYIAAKQVCKLRYWTKMVQISRKMIEVIKQQVNDLLISDNGTDIIKMAYEEVLFPVIFTGKKKYCGTPHYDDENFFPKLGKHFIKGIDIVKQGQSELTKRAGFEIIYEACHPYNENSLYDIVMNKIKEVYETCVNKIEDINVFAKTAKYKPGVKNVFVQVFLQRMRERRKLHESRNEVVDAAIYEELEPGDRFNYVIVKQDVIFDLGGHRKKYNIGQRAEYVSAYLASQGKPNAMKIDLSYYMDKSISGLMARFISYKPEFSDNVDEEHIDDEKSILLAKKHILEYSDRLMGIDKAILRTTGHKYRSLTKKVVDEVKKNFIQQYGIHLADIHGLLLNKYVVGTDQQTEEDALEEYKQNYDEAYIKTGEEAQLSSNNFIEAIKEYAKVAIVCNVDVDKFVCRLVDIKVIPLLKLRDIYYTRIQVLAKLYKQREQECLTKLRTHVDSYIRYIQRYESLIESIITKIRNSEELDKIINENAATTKIITLLAPYSDEITAVNGKDKELIEFLQSSIICLRALYRINECNRRIVETIADKISIAADRISSIKDIEQKRKNPQLLKYNTNTEHAEIDAVYVSHIIEPNTEKVEVDKAYVSGVREHKFG